MIEWIISISTELFFLTICVMILSSLALLSTIRLWFYVRQQREINSSLQSRVIQVESQLRQKWNTGARDMDTQQPDDQEIVALLKELHEVSESFRRPGLIPTNPHQGGKADLTLDIQAKGKDGS